MCNPYFMVYRNEKGHRAVSARWPFSLGCSIFVSLVSFNPRPLVGDDYRRPENSCPRRSFNPRSPRGERPVSPLNIHGGYWFQSPFPRGGRLYDTRFTKQFFKFQSPFPVRGTTVEAGSVQAIQRVSIPVPTRGTTSSNRCERYESNRFNPRPPCGERPRSARPTTSLAQFQSPFPLRGTTLGATSIVP